MPQIIKKLIHFKPYGFNDMSIYDIFKFLFESFKNGNYRIKSSAISFNFFLAVFPAMLFLITLIPFIHFFFFPIIFDSLFCNFIIYFFILDFYFYLCVFVGFIFFLVLFFLQLFFIFLFLIFIYFFSILFYSFSSFFSLSSFFFL